MAELEPGVCRIRWAEPGDRPIAEAAHALAREVLGPLLATEPTAVRWDYRCASCGGPHGKPSLPGEPVHFSLTHAIGLVAVAVAGDPVGLDVEVATSGLDPDELAGVALTTAEQTAYAGLPAERRPAAMLRTWTRKEALLKADGRGLSISPEKVRVSAPDAAPRLLEWRESDPPGDPQLFDLDLGPGRYAAVAVLSPTIYRIELEAHRW